MPNILDFTPSMKLLTASVTTLLYFREFRGMQDKHFPSQSLSNIRWVIQGTAKSYFNFEGRLRESDLLQMVRYISTYTRFTFHLCLLAF